jgi:hypothetical protein
MVRQMFEIGILQSGFWHQFAMTAHSPVGMYPDRFGVLKENNEVGTFANNDINFTDKTGIDHDQFSFGLKKSLYNFMHGICFDYELQDWFDFKVPKTKIAKDFIESALIKSDIESDKLVLKPNAKIIWVGGTPNVAHFTKSKKGNTWAMLTLTFHNKKECFVIQIEKEKGEWLLKMLEKTNVLNPKVTNLKTLKEDFELDFEDFELFWFSKPIDTLRNAGLLIL